MASLRAGWSPEMVSTVAPVVTATVTGDGGGTVTNLRVTVTAADDECGKMGASPLHA